MLRPLPLHGQRRPGKRRWAADRLFPERRLSLLVANGGSGKSLLALYIAECVALGLPILGHRTRRGRVLYLDFELDAEETLRRAHGVADGMGVSLDDAAFADRLFYLRCGSLSDENTLALIREAIDEHEITFVVVDSLSIAAGGADVNAASDVVLMLGEIVSWGITVLALDHVTKGAAQGLAPASAFGSIFKSNMARAVWLLDADGRVRTLTLDKSNFAPRGTRVRFTMTFEEGEVVTFEPLEDQAPLAPAGAPEEETLWVVQALHEAQLRPISIAEVMAFREERGLPVKGIKTVKNHLAELRKRGRILGASNDEIVPASTLAAPPLASVPDPAVRDKDQEDDAWDEELQPPQRQLPSVPRSGFNHL